ncbi:MAG: type II toxin-antitoxin system RelE/ParE family toxin [Gammaproteobacteria bacterium]|nr:MAG: type II toxin-antitoxin system RelE/ParE family toxin [Gammaproteobacteria bacterium]
MKLVVRSAANRDIIAAAEFYERKRIGLGREFFREVDAIFSVFRRLPYIGQAIDGDPGLRGFQLKRFPYQVIYRLRNDELKVLAVTHQRRQPEKGRYRVQEESAIYRLAA